MCRLCEEFIERHSKILDLGCGSGIIGKEFQKYFKSELLGVDIKKNLIKDIPFQLANGENLPFKEKSFDIVLLNFVLHHTKDPEQVLREAKRVGKKIIIFEDLPKGCLGRLFCLIHGESFAIFFQKTRNYGNFKSEREWEDIFEKLKLKVIYKRRVANFPIRKELFVLRT